MAFGIGMIGGDSEWMFYEKLLEKHDSAIDAELKKAWENGVDDYGQLGRVEVGLHKFFSYACKRSSVWIQFAEDYYLPDIFADNPDLVREPKIAEMLINFCNACSESEGYYEDDDCCCDDDGGTLNRWVYVLMKAPQLAVHCSTFQKFNGYSRCMLLAKQPQLAAKFSLEELGDPKGKCWSTCDADDYQGGWESLVEAHPDFVQYKKGNCYGSSIEI